MAAGVVIAGEEDGLFFIMLVKVARSFGDVFPAAGILLPKFRVSSLVSFWSGRGRELKIQSSKSSKLRWISREVCEGSEGGGGGCAHAKAQRRKS